MKSRTEVVTLKPEADCRFGISRRKNSKITELIFQRLWAILLTNESNLCPCHKHKETGNFTSESYSKARSNNRRVSCFNDQY